MRPFRPERIPIFLDVLALLGQKSDLKRDDVLQLLRRVDGLAAFELPEEAGEFRLAIEMLVILLTTVAFGQRSRAEDGVVARCASRTASQTLGRPQRVDPLNPRDRALDQGE
jgi:hypothetical protein